MKSTILVGGFTLSKIRCVFRGREFAHPDLEDIK